MKKLSEIKPKKWEDPKVICDNIEALKLKYHDQAEIDNNNTIAMCLFSGVCQVVQIGIDASSSWNRDQWYRYYTQKIMRHMNVAWRAESGGEGVMQEGKG